MATEAGVNVQTLRYYERRGLLAAPARLPSGYRGYRPETVRIVRFVKQAQQLGFSLEEIATLPGPGDRRTGELRGRRGPRLGEDRRAGREDRRPRGDA